MVCHNLRGYDSHLVIEQIYQLYPNKDILSIPKNYEKFMSFKIGELKFIDSSQFMSSSIEKLSENSYEHENDKKQIQEHEKMLPRTYGYLM